MQINETREEPAARLGDIPKLPLPTTFSQMESSMWASILRRSVAERLYFTTTAQVQSAVNIKPLKRAVLNLFPASHEGEVHS